MMVRDYLLVLLFILLVNFLFAASPKRALKLLEKDKFEKTEKQLHKLLEKDSITPGAYYVYSLLYLDSGYVHFNLDSSWIYINKARVQYPLIDEKKEKKLDRAGIDSARILHQKLKLDTLAYQVAMDIHTIPGYNEFLTQHPTAPQRDSAIERRNELAYQDVLQENTYEAYKRFMETYPGARQLQEAEEFYQILLYKDKTADGLLSSYRNFLRQYPNTPYREDAVQNIYNLSTADHTADSYLQFFKDFPKSRLKKKSIDFLYHLFKSENIAGYFFSHFNLADIDSLQKVIDLEGHFLVPVLKDSLYGFRNSKWQNMLSPQFSKIEEEYFCGNITTDYLLVAEQGKSKVIGRNGAVIFQEPYQSVQDLGAGALKIVQSNQAGVVHKSGIRILDFDWEDAQVIDNRFIKVKKDGLWGLYSFSGLKLLETEFEDIYQLGDFYLFKKEGLLAVTNARQVLKTLNKEPVDFEHIYEEVELIDQDFLLAYRADAETLINKALKTVIPLDRHQIYELNDGWLIKRHNRYQVLSRSFQPLSDTTFQKVIYNDHWLALQKTNKWSFITPDKMFSAGFVYDSVKLLSNHFAYLSRADSAWIYFRNDTIRDVSEADKIQVLTALNRQQNALQNEFLVVFHKNNKLSIFNTLGKEIILGTYDEASLLGNEYIVVGRRKQKGLYSQSGELLLKPFYDGIGNYENGFISILNSKRFGIYNLNKNINLPPRYESMLKPYNQDLIIARKNQSFGLITSENKTILDFDYLTINYWTDSLALVQLEKSHWQIIDIYSEEIILDNINEYKVLEQNEEETIVMINIDAQYGIFSNQRGEILTPTYNDIINLGTSGQPIYFAEKHIREANFFVVIYYDKDGEILQRQAFTEEEYEQIYCQ